METLRVLIADDHVFFRDGLRSLLDSVTDAEIAGEATNGEEAVTLAARLQPDVILMDIKMSGLNGIEATRQIHLNTPHIGILIVTMFEDDQSVFAAMQAGARGYLLKGADHSEMLRAIRAVGSGEAIFSPTIALRLITYFSNLKPAKLARVFPELTEREREILNLIAQGYKNPEIASKLVLSPKTVRNQISNILNKLEVADRTQAILLAREAGLGQTDNNRK